MEENEIGKCVEKFNNSHKKIAAHIPGPYRMCLGYLLNFNESLMKKGINSMVDRLVE